MVLMTSTTRVWRGGAAAVWQGKQHVRRCSGKSGASTGRKIDGIRRFYKNVGILPFPSSSSSSLTSSSEAAYVVTLDGKKLKTPSQNVVKIPSKSFAWAIAHEWDAQIGQEGLKAASMPLMAFASTCLDTPQFDSTTQKQALIDEMMPYFNCDTTCFEAEPLDHRLLKLQRKVLTRVRTWFETEFQTTLDVNDGTHLGRLHHPEAAITSVVAYLNTRSSWQLLAMKILTRDCKSLVIALALEKRHLTVAQAIEAARLEEESQIETWGLVEGGHDLDRANIKASVASASTALWFLDNTTLSG